jgi:triacylglycerol lipase
MPPTLNSLAELGEELFSQDPSVQSAETPLWRESLTGLEWAALHASPVYWGCGVEHGRGEPVVVVPGFLASDISLIELHAWLGRIGYRPYFSNIGRNADCPDHIGRALLQTVRQAYDECGQTKVRLVGHSLGGMLSRHIALDYPEYVAGVISMGSPFRETVRAHPIILAAAAALRRQRGKGSSVGQNIRPTCFSGHCACAFNKNMLNPGEYQMPHFAIYSKGDGVVEWEGCAEQESCNNDEVVSTHLGMAWNPSVYRVVARRLAEMREPAAR